MKVLIYIVLLLVPICMVKATEKHILIKDIPLHTEGDGFLEAKLEFGFPKEINHYKIRPFISNGNVEIYSEELERYVGGMSLWQDLPHVTDYLRLKVESSDQQFQLSFQVMDLRSGLAYETSKMIVWADHSTRKYISNLNRNLLSRNIHQHRQLFEYSKNDKIR